MRPSAIVTGDAAYVRLHGRNASAWFSQDSGRDERYNYLYSDEELDGWVRKIRELVETSSAVYAFTNNHYRGQAVVNALEIQASLGIRKASPPETLKYLYPRLGAIFVD